MRESRTYVSVRGALSNERPYRDQGWFAAVHESGCGTSRQFTKTDHSVTIGGIADMPRNPAARPPDANDPSRKSRHLFCCHAIRCARV